MEALYWYCIGIAGAGFLLGGGVQMLDATETKWAQRIGQAAAAIGLVLLIAAAKHL